jgi:hypothetical protein
MRQTKLTMKPTGKEFQGTLSLARAKRLEIRIEGYRQTQARQRRDAPSQKRS